jgi:hypothetical protein
MEPLNIKIEYTRRDHQLQLVKSRCELQHPFHAHFQPGILSSRATRSGESFPALNFLL